MQEGSGKGNMMKLACNYSPELMELVSAGEAPVDFVKAGAYGLFLEELPKIRAIRPVLLHGMGKNERTGMPDYRALDYDRMNELLRRYGSPHLGIHLAVTNADAGGGLTDGEIDRRMAECAHYFRERIRVPLLLENVGDSPDERVNYDLIPFVEPERIRRVLEASGAGLLLDITHAKVAAQYRRWDLRAYLSEFPLDKVGEVHLTGSAFDADGAPYDAHGPLGEEDFETLSWVLARTDPAVVTLEYGGPAGFQGPQADRAVLLDQLRRIHSIIMGRQC